MTWACFPQRRVALRGVSETSVEGGVGKSQTAWGWVQDCGGCDSHKVSGVLTVTPAKEAPEPRTGHRRPAVCAGWACAVSSSTLSWFYSTYWVTSRREPWRAVSRPPPAGSLLGPGCHTRHQQSRLGQTETGRRRVPAELGQLCAFLLPLVPPLPRWPLTMAPGPEPKGVVIFQTTKPAPAPRWSTARPCRGPCTYLWYQFTLISSV